MGSGTSQENPQIWLAWLMGTQSLNQQPGILHGTDLCMKVSDSCVGWPILGHGSRTVPDAFLADSWESLPHAGLPCPACIQGEALRLKAS